VGQMRHRDFIKRDLILLTALLVALIAATMVLVVPAQADTTITVTTTSDVIASDGWCSLREAIIAANTDTAFNGCPAGSGADTIVFAANLPQPATFVLTRSGANENAASTGDLDIVGTLTINGAGSANTILDGNGIDRVFEIRPGAHVTISGVTIRNGDPAGDLGGGVKVLGALTMNDSSVESNHSGGIRNEGGNLTLSNTDIISNTGRGGVYNGGSSLARLTMTGCRVTGNATTGSGGGIFNENGATANINDTLISDNSATAGGGGVSNYSIMTLDGSTISHNQATRGGGIDAAGVTLHLTNDTISGNTANDNGGGIYNATGIFLTNVTLVSNTASGNGGGIFNDESNAYPKNTIIAANQSVDGNCSSSQFAAVVSQGHNLASDNTCSLTAAGDLPNANPSLGPLQDNGGPTPTHALLPGSPAIDQGDDLACPAADQRGIPRPQGAACDIGAYESGATADLTLAVSVAPYLVAPGQGMTYTLVVNNLGPSVATSLVLTDSLPSGVTFIAADMAGGGTCTYSGVVSCTLSSLIAGSSVTSTIAVTAPASLGVLTNLAWVTAATPDLNPGNSQVTTITPVSQIRKIYLPFILRD